MAALLPRLPRLPDAELLARLVGFDTTSRLSNLPLADFLCDYLDLPGVEVVRVPSEDGGKANLALGIGPEPGPGRRGLVLSGHMDVVPAEEEEWESDPFALADRGDRWVGRGACDMKGFLALAANLFAEAATEGELLAPLVLLLTYDEEWGRSGRGGWSSPGPTTARRCRGARSSASRRRCASSAFTRGT